MNQPIDKLKLSQTVENAVSRQSVVDMHTHLFSPTFGDDLCLWGIDGLLTYHYLICEVYRVVPASKLPHEQFWKMSRSQQADHIWKNLFVENTPLSEACRGVLTTLEKLGLDPNEKSLDSYRRFFAQQNPDDYINRVMELSNVSSITMTNSVFDDNERERWLRNPRINSDPRFKAVLRIDPLLLDWPSAARKLRGWGYAISEEISESTIAAVRKFLREWMDRQQAIYVAVSLPPEFRYPASSPSSGQKILEQAVLPVCTERGLPFAMMIGARRGVNPAMREAGDMGGIADVGAIANLCRQFPQNKFFVTMLARENQHELCVAARKFDNLMIFGCWWFLNTPSMIEEIERMRFELLGTSFIPQHSDARILDQLLYKWDHSRRIIAKVLTEKYADLLASGRRVSDDDIARDARLLLADNFTNFLKR